MIPTPNKFIKTHPIPTLTADEAEYNLLLTDMIFHAGPLLPCPNWLMTEDVSADATTYDPNKALEYACSKESFSKIQQFLNLMSAWVGGGQPPSEIEINKYSAFLLTWDVLDLWEANTTNPPLPLGRQDLGSLMDLNLLYAHSMRPGKRTRILEVGGGYGRLAEAAWNIFGSSVQYVMIDSVPASMYYARKYLAAACPDARIGSYYDSDFNLTHCDIAIIPAWHFERLNSLRYDICINIESMQEMNQHHVDYYLDLFNRLTINDGTIYLSNAHDYYFKGKFNYPPNWTPLFNSNTPRSNLCQNHPTEIFRKSGPAQ